MKYLRYYLIRAGLCLLLVCSANGQASAQMDGNDEPLVASLEMVSISTTTLGIATIDFRINFKRATYG